MIKVNEEEVITSIEDLIFKKCSLNNIESSLIINISFNEKSDKVFTEIRPCEETDEKPVSDCLSMNELLNENIIYEIISLILVDHDIILNHKVKENKILMEFVLDSQEEIIDVNNYKSIKLILDFNNCNNKELIDKYNNYINNHLIDYMKNVDFYKKEYEKYIVCKKLKK